MILGPAPYTCRVAIALVKDLGPAAEAPDLRHGTVARVDDDGVAAAAPPRVGLDALDRRTLDLLLDDSALLVTSALETATALAGNDRDLARVQLVAKAIGCEHARQLALAALLDERILCRDLDGVAMLDRVLLNSTRRLCALIREHHAACSTGRRNVVVAVAHVDQLHVGKDR